MVRLPWINHASFVTEQLRNMVNEELFDHSTTTVVHLPYKHDYTMAMEPWFAIAYMSEL